MLRRMIYAIKNDPGASLSTLKILHLRSKGRTIERGAGCIQILHFNRNALSKPSVPHLTGPHAQSQSSIKVITDYQDSAASISARKCSLLASLLAVVSFDCLFRLDNLLWLQSGQQVGEHSLQHQIAVKRNLKKYSEISGLSLQNSSGLSTPNDNWVERTDS